jgi:hypothetical protein
MLAWPPDLRFIQTADAEKQQLANPRMFAQNTLWKPNLYASLGGICGSVYTEFQNQPNDLFLLHLFDVDMRWEGERQLSRSDRSLPGEKEDKRTPSQAVMIVRRYGNSMLGPKLYKKVSIGVLTETFDWFSRPTTLECIGLV